MPDLTAQFLAQATGGRLVGEWPQAELAGVSTDSRSIAPGQLFVALAGPNHDGHDHVAAALAAGATGAVVRAGFDLAGSPQAPLCVVADTLTALGDLAAAWRRAHVVKVVALTGSNGKTTTKEMLGAILERRFRVLKTQGNLNNLIGLPLTVLELKKHHEVAVLEMGMSALGEIARLTEIARPDVGLVTNVGPAHIGPMKSLENIVQAKTELFRGLALDAVAVVNQNDIYLSPFSQTLDCRVLEFGTEPCSPVRLSDPATLGSKSAFNLALDGGAVEARVTLSAPGKHNLENALAAAACAHALGVDLADIKAGLEAFRPVKGRLQIKRAYWGGTIVDDTYNANPASVAAGLEALGGIASGRRKGLILGDMLELGEGAAAMHRQMGKLAAKQGFRLVLAVGEYAQDVVQGARQGGMDETHAQAFTQMVDLIEVANDLLDDQDVVLVKGSRGSRMERAVAALVDGEAV